MPLSGAVIIGQAACIVKLYHPGTALPCAYFSSLQECLAAGWVNWILAGKGIFDCYLGAVKSYRNAVKKKKLCFAHAP